MNSSIAIFSPRTLGAFLFSLIGVVGLISCATASTAPIPTDLNPAKYFQLVQEMIDGENFPEAQRYLVEFAHRNVDSQDLAIKDKLIEAEYLLAQIDYKQGKLNEARQKYEALLQKYEGLAETETSPPQWIRVLCTKLVATISKKQEQSKPDTPNPAK